jgi:LPXTG-motif cell wall-anchored protein
MSLRVVNLKGSTLPQTGGIGTTIFYVVGTILVLGAAVVLITRKRMSAEEQ